jgi:hypothetical protein
MGGTTFVVIRSLSVRVPVPVPVCGSWFVGSNLT